MKTIVLIVKCILPVFLFLCLIDFPYGYYMFVRWLGMIGFTLIAVYEFQRERTAWGIIYIALALLFQPIVKIPLGRTLWNVVDVILGVWLIVSIFIENDRNDTSNKK